MNKVFISCLLTLFFLSSKAQVLPDTLIVQYNSVHSDSEKGRKLSEYLYSLKGESDQQISKTLEILAWFKKGNDEVGTNYTELNLARILERSSDYTNSLKYAFSVLSRFEKRNDDYGTMRALNNIGNAMENSQNIEQGIEYYKKTLPLALKMGDKTHYAYGLNNIGNAYAKIHRADSALIYAQQAVNMSREANDPEFITYAISSLGESYMAKGEQDIARPFLRRGLENAKSSADNFAMSYAYNDFSQSFMATGEYDSARVYATKAVQYSLAGHHRDQSLRAYEFLLGSFEKTNKQDSINKYFRLAMTTKDTLYSIEKTRNIQTMGYQEQIRQMEVETENAKAAEERKDYIQYAAIAIGLILFLSIFFLLSKSVIVHEKWISYIGILGVLFVFEFIDLIIHPYVVMLTHHSPVYMLLILVGVASLLIPIHHRIEKFIREKVIEKNRKIRLLAAKKTIERLESIGENI